jgi:tetratricopeptide (TPR) repeat protein
VSRVQSAPISNIPDRNLFFTGRERVLMQLQEALAAQGRVALSGLAGIAKTQTAVEYAHRHLNEYDYAFWMTAHSREALISGYATTADLLGISLAEAQDQASVVRAVKQWLSAHQRWLLILDNADNLAMVRELIPTGRNAHVLLTTQAQAVGEIPQRVEIQEMEGEEGALFLLRRAKYILGDELFAAASPADQDEAKAIAAQLDGLPLALHQAGAYIKETGCGLSGYRDLYRSHALDLLGRRGALASDHAADHPEPVATTWALSFEKIEQANPVAAELLRLCAFMHPDGIPEEVLSKGAPELGPVLGTVGSDAFALNTTISEILKYSLLRRDPMASTLEIHRLVQTVLKQGMDEATKRLWAERAVRTVNRVFQSVHFSTWAGCERLLSQAEVCAELISNWAFEFPEAARLLNVAAKYLVERGRYSDAESLLQRSLAIREKALGSEHLDEAISVNNLAGFYEITGQYLKAEPLYKRAVLIRENVLGPDHPDLANSLNGLGVYYHTRGKYTKAEALYQQALAIRENVLGPEHPDVATSLNNLASLYRLQGQYAKAEPLHERSLAIRINARGPEHPDVAQSLNNFADLYRAQGHYAKAESFYGRSLTIRENALGPEHPNVASTLNNLAELYVTLGRYGKTEPLYQRALAIRKKVFGPEHPRMAESLHGLARLYETVGRYTDAEPFYQRALAIRENALGPEHPDVALSLNNVAEFYRALGRYVKAEPLYQRAVLIRENVLGPDHPDLANSLNSLAGLYRVLSHYEKAEPLYKRAMSIREKA